MDEIKFIYNGDHLYTDISYRLRKEKPGVRNLNVTQRIYIEGKFKQIHQAFHLFIDIHPSFNCLWFIYTRDEEAEKKK